jgi:hypothetical protein
VRVRNSDRPSHKSGHRRHHHHLHRSDSNLLHLHRDWNHRHHRPHDLRILPRQALKHGGRTIHAQRASRGRSSSGSSRGRAGPDHRHRVPDGLGRPYHPGGDDRRRREENASPHPHQNRGRARLCIDEHRARRINSQCHREQVNIRGGGSMGTTVPSSTQRRTQSTLE